MVTRNYQFLSSQDRDKMIGILKKLLKNNQPTIAVLASCCFIDALSSNYRDKCGWKRFKKYFQDEMPDVLKQLSENDKNKINQIKNLDCDIHRGHPKHCKSSVEIFYRHIRCGLVHDFFNKSEVLVINKPNKKAKGVIVDKSKKNADYALVINAPVFVKNFYHQLN